jgi:hypothetical protein
MESTPLVWVIWSGHILQHNTLQAGGVVVSHRLKLDLLSFSACLWHWCSPENLWASSNAARFKAANHIFAFMNDTQIDATGVSTAKFFYILLHSKVLFRMHAMWATTSFFILSFCVCRADAAKVRKLPIAYLFLTKRTTSTVLHVCMSSILFSIFCRSFNICTPQNIVSWMWNGSTLTLKIGRRIYDQMWNEVLEFHCRTHTGNRKYRKTFQWVVTQFDNSSNWWNRGSCQLERIQLQI